MVDEDDRATIAAAANAAADQTGDGVSPTPRLPTYFHHLDGLETWTVDDYVPLPIGTGVIVAGARGDYRVSDVWFSMDHHGPLDDGPHIFLARTDDGPPGGY